MHDRRDRDHDPGQDDPHGDRGGGDGGRRGGPPGTEFLDLEISKVLYGEASSRVREAFGELLRDEIKARIKERFGHLVTGLAELAIDDLAGDLSANLAVETLIRQRGAARRETEEKLRRLFEEHAEKKP